MNGARISRPPAHRITVVQLAVLLSLWVGMASWNTLTAMSFGLGGLVAVIPNAWFALGVFRWRGGSFASRATRAGFSAEIGKFLLSVAGFALVFALVRPIEGWAVFAGYGAMLVIQVIGAWWLLRRTVSGKP
jgi:ATP synthase protein I